MQSHKSSQSLSHTLSTFSRSRYIILVLAALLFQFAGASETTSSTPSPKIDSKMADFVGTYKYESDDGKFDDFLKAMDVSFVIRKIAVNTSPTIEISVKDDGTCVVKTTSTFKTSQIEFKLGEEFEEKRMDGNTVKTTITRDGNKLVQKQTADPPVEIIREFSGDKLTTTCKCKDVVTVRTYKKQATTN